MTFPEALEFSFYIASVTLSHTHRTHAPAFPTVSQTPLPRCHLKLSTFKMKFLMSLQNLFLPVFSSRVTVSPNENISISWFILPYPLVLTGLQILSFLQKTKTKQTLPYSPEKKITLPNLIHVSLSWMLQQPPKWYPCPSFCLLQAALHMAAGVPLLKPFCVTSQLLLRAPYLASIVCSLFSLAQSHRTVLEHGMPSRTLPLSYLLTQPWRTQISPPR